MADAKVAPYVRGQQDIRENQSTFQWFWDYTVWSIVGIFVLLAILAYFFAHDVDRCKPGASTANNVPGNCTAAAPSK
jgi:hypothetical protein